MKISKLFHWLYALVMLLPIFAIGVTCGYAMFNKNAYKSLDNNYTLQELTDYEELKTGDRYVYKSPNFNAVNTLNQDNSSMTISNVDYNGNNYNSCTIWFYGSVNCLIYMRNNFDNSMVFNGVRPNTVYFEFDYDTSVFQNNTYFVQISKFYKIQDYSLENVFYSSVNKVKESPMFSWAYNSFLSAPLLYIVTLFSIPANHVVVQLLSYWLAISIIWLVFDLIMYVPLLVHRWIDKGILE